MDRKLRSWVLRIWRSMKTEVSGASIASSVRNLRGRRRLVKGMGCFISNLSIGFQASCPSLPKPEGGGGIDFWMSDTVLMSLDGPTKKVVAKPAKTSATKRFMLLIIHGIFRLGSSLILYAEPTAPAVKAAPRR